MEIGNWKCILHYTIWIFDFVHINIKAILNNNKNHFAIPEYIKGQQITSIADDAFYGCSSLTNIIIPKSVTSIGEGAFACCRSLTNIVIPNSVTSVGNGAFYNCSSLTNY